MCQGKALGITYFSLVVDATMKEESMLAQLKGSMAYFTVKENNH